MLIVWVGGSYIDNGTIQTGDLIAFITYAMVIMMGFLMIGMISIMLPRADVAAQRVNEVLETKPTICDPAADKARDAELRRSDEGATIAFNDVSFRYGDSKECVLEHIDFTAESGKTTALIGSTGSGKSTVIKLIERFYDVTEGSVTIDGVDVRDVTQQALREQLGYVPQKAFLFSGTIESNVAYADEGMPVDRIREAVDIAQASEFVASKEEGLGTRVSQGGSNVSGGQRQRLAIARALATEARAYLFDDSFSALQDRRRAAPGAAHAPGRQDRGHRGAAHLDGAACRPHRGAGRRPHRGPGHAREADGNLRGVSGDRDVPAVGSRAERR